MIMGWVGLGFGVEKNTHFLVWAMAILKANPAKIIFGL